MEQACRTPGLGTTPDDSTADTTPEPETSKAAALRWRYDSAVHAARALNAPRS